MAVRQGVRPSEPEPPQRDPTPEEMPGSQPIRELAAAIRDQVHPVTVIHGEPSGPPPADQIPLPIYYSSSTIGRLVAALATAQSHFPTIVKNKTVTVQPGQNARPGARAYTFSYATLDAVLAACVPVLGVNGLAFTQIFDDSKLVTLLMHSSGEFMGSSLACAPAAGESLQQFGSRMTYLRRYMAGPLFGVGSEDDDDGNASDGNAVEEQPRAAQRSGSSGNSREAPRDAQPAQRSQRSQEGAQRTMRARGTGNGGAAPPAAGGQGTATEPPARRPTPEQEADLRRTQQAFFARIQEIGFFADNAARQLWCQQLTGKRTTADWNMQDYGTANHELDLLEQEGGPPGAADLDALGAEDTAGATEN